MTIYNPKAKTHNVTISAQEVINLLQKCINESRDCDVRICVPYADGIGFQLLPIVDIHACEGRIDIVTTKFE
jgi:hypothetical protein